MANPTFRTTTLPFKSLNDEFATLQNVELDLKTSDGNFANVNEIAIKKRRGTTLYGTAINATGFVHSLLSYVNKTADYLIAGYNTDLYKFAETTLAASVTTGDTTIDLTDASTFTTSGTIYIGTDSISYTGKSTNTLTGVTKIDESHANASRVQQRVWKSIKSSLTADATFGSTTMNSYSGTATVTGTVTLEHTGTWDTCVYDVNTGFSKLTDTGSAWQEDKLIGRNVEVNTTNFSSVIWTIVQNGTNWIMVEGNVVGGNTTTSSSVGFTTVAVAVTTGDTTITLTSGANFPTSGTINIDDNIISYTGKSTNDLTGCSNILVNHNSGVNCFSAEVNLTSAAGFISDSGMLTSGSQNFYYNGKSGNKLINLSNVSATVASGAEIYDTAYKTKAAKPYSIYFNAIGTRLVDTSKSWTTDAYGGYIVLLTAGTGVGQQRRISANDKDNLMIEMSWEIEPDNTTTYSIYSTQNQILYMGNGVDSTMRYDGTTVTSLTRIPKGNVFMSYANRLFIIGPANEYSVYYSDTDDPEYFDPTYIITPPGNDKVVSVAVWNDKGIIFKEESVWSFYFTWNSSSEIWDLTLDQVPCNSGCKSARSVQKVENVIWFYDGEVVKYLGASPNQIGVIRTESISFPIDNMLAATDPSMYSSVVSSYNGYEYRMAACSTATGTSNDIIYVYDTAYRVWHTRTGNNVSSMVMHDGTMYYGEYGVAEVWEMDTDAYDDGGTEEINMIIMTKDMDLGAPTIFKTFRWVNFGFENITSSARILTKVYSTKYTLTREKNIDIGFGVSGSGTIGEAEIGPALFGGTGSDSPRRVIRKQSIGFSGTRIQVRIQNNTIDENLIITDLGFVWYPRTIRHFPTDKIF